MPNPSPLSLDDLIRAHGARVTSSRVAVLGALKASDKALTHLEVEKALETATIDRVTIYRVLDWLAEQGLAHKVSDGGRAVRFSAHGADEGHQAHAHAHFKCNLCEGVYCLEDVKRPTVSLPAGFVQEAFDLTVLGICKECRPTA
jgi:Fur family transcriptional regulator, ferric uptake regulator